MSNNNEKIEEIVNDNEGGVNLKLSEKSIIFTQEYREIEQKFFKAANLIKNQIPDKSKSFSEQGMENLVNHQSAEAIIKIVKTIRKEKEQKFIPKKTYI